MFEINLKYILAFRLTDIAQVYLAFYLTSVLAFHLTGMLTFYLAYLKNK